MIKIVGSILVVSIVFVFGFVFLSSLQIVPESSVTQDSPPFENTQASLAPITDTQASLAPITDTQASFAIFTNGIFRVFTASMYHNLSSEVYIEASNPAIVHSKKPNTTWGDFFSTLPFKLTHECLTTGTGQTFCTGSNGTLRFYINGEKNVNALDQRINYGDKLLVTFGNESEVTIKKQFDRIPNLK